MKQRLVTAFILLATLSLSGCGSLAGRHNIDSGFAYIDSHEYSSALESFEAAQENGEDPCLIHRGKGIAYLESGEAEMAADELLQSLACDEGIVGDMDFDTNYYLAEAYLELKEYNKAKEVYDAILGLRDKDSNAYYLRGIAELASGNHDAGYSDFTKAITLNSRDYAMIIMIYKALDEYGYSDEAINILRKYGLDKAVMAEMTWRIQAVMEGWSGGRMQVEIVVFSNVHGELGRTGKAL